MYRLVLAAFVGVPIAAGCGLALDLDPTPAQTADATARDASTTGDASVRGHGEAGMDGAVRPDGGGGGSDGSVFVRDAVSVDAIVAEDARAIDGTISPVDGGVPTVDGAPADAGPPGGICRVNADCRLDELCEQAVAGTCAGTGTCVPISDCPPTTVAECGCNNRDYTSTCERQRARTALARVGPCECAIRPSDMACCYVDSHCPTGNVCVTETFCGGDPGVCKDLPPAGQCWEDADCPHGTCEGEYVCPCGFSCFAPDMLGTCGPPP